MAGEQTGKDSLFYIFYIFLIVSLQDCLWLEAKETAARQNFGGWRLTKVAILIFDTWEAKNFFRFEKKSALLSSTYTNSTSGKQAMIHNLFMYFQFRELAL